MLPETDQTSPATLPLGASVELSPRQIAKDHALLARVPSGARVYIVDTGATALDDWLRAARTVAAAGLVPVPHIAARRVPSRRDLESRVAALSGEVGVDDMLVIGGGARSPAGPYASTMDVLETGLLDRHNVRKIGIAGHPEGCPDIAPDAIAQALAWKTAWAARTGAELRLVTQFGFDTGAVLAWSTALAKAGNALPMHLGIAGPTGLASLLKYAAMCGVRTSMAVAARRGAALSALVTSYTPEPMALAIERHVTASPAVPIAQLHVFPFGGLAATIQWLASRGSWPPAQAASENGP